MGRQTVLVTGAAGFIGFHVARALLAEGLPVVGVDSFNPYYCAALKEARAEVLRKEANFSEERGDVADGRFVARLMDAHKPGRVCHLAAQVGVRYSMTNPFVYQSSNVQGFLNVLDAAKNAGVERFVYASSSSVYGDSAGRPSREDDRADAPLSLYAATKRADELMAHAYSHGFGVRTVGLRFFTVYGPWGRPDMAPWLFTEAILAGNPIRVFSHGKGRRDFTYIDDIVRGVVAAMSAPNLERNEILNLGDQHPEDVMRLIGILEGILGREAKREFLPAQPGDVDVTCADISRSREKLGFEPKVELPDGLGRFVEWYRDHPELAAEVARSRAAGGAK